MPDTPDIPADYEELPYPQEYDYLWTEERDWKYEEHSAGFLSPGWLFGHQDDAEARQGVVSALPFVLRAILVGVAFSALIFIAPLINPPKLENDPLCGIPTGGQVFKNIESKILTTSLNFTRKNVGGIVIFYRTHSLEAKPSSTPIA